MMNNESHYKGIVSNCEQCNVTLKSKSQYGRKRKICDLCKIKRKYPCEECQYESSNKTILKDHIIAIHENLKPYLCDKCEFKSATKIGLKDHQNSIHGSEVFECDICSFVTKTKNYLQKHFRNNHLEGRKKHSCTNCDYQSKHKQDLDRHMFAKHSNLNIFRRCKK